MSQPQDDTRVTAPEPAHRSRWRRFSPSMGWRAFWSEIVIVVLGVAIALAANEAVENWNWRNKVRDAEARLQGDIAWAFLWAAEKSASQPCVDAQLAAAARNVLDSGDMLRPMPVVTTLDLQSVVRMPNRPYRFPVWDALLADGTASHFATQRQALFGRISDGMAMSRASEVETRRLGGNLLRDARSDSTRPRRARGPADRHQQPAIVDRLRRAERQAADARDRRCRHRPAGRNGRTVPQCLRQEYHQVPISPA